LRSARAILSQRLVRQCENELNQSIYSHELWILVLLAALPAATEVAIDSKVPTTATYRLLLASFLAYLKRDWSLNILREYSEQNPKRVLTEQIEKRLEVLTFTKDISSSRVRTPSPTTARFRKLKEILRLYCNNKTCLWPFLNDIYIQKNLVHGDLFPSLRQIQVFSNITSRPLAQYIITDRVPIARE
jgi:hypothetical protein